MTTDNTASEKTDTVDAAKAPVAYADMSSAPLPTAKTLRQRRSLPLQATRFMSFNARIMKMVLKGH